MSTKKIDNTVRQSFFPQRRNIGIREILPPHIKIFTEGEKQSHIILMVLLIKLRQNLLLVM